MSLTIGSGKSIRIENETSTRKMAAKLEDERLKALQVLELDSDATEGINDDSNVAVI